MLSYLVKPISVRGQCVREKIRHVECLFQQKTGLLKQNKRVYNITQVQILTIVPRRLVNIFTNNVIQVFTHRSTSLYFLYY